VTFTAAAQESASERFFLVQIQPRRFVGVGTSIGGGQYTFSVSSDVIISSVTVNNVNEPTWTHAANVLTVTSATDLTVSSNIVTIDYNIYATGTVARETNGVSGIPNANWLPIIRQYPELSQTMRNIADGVFSLSNTDIDLVSTDRWGQSILGENDSLSKAPVKVWSCINGATTNKKVFDGEVSSVSYSYGRISLSVLDVFNRLKDSASFGERATSHIYTGNSGQYPNPDDENSVVTMTIGKSSPYSVANGWRHLDPYGSPHGAVYHLNSGYRAIKTAPQNPVASSTITFMIGRGVGTDVKRINFGTISAAYEKWVSRTIPRASNDPSAGLGTDLTIYEKIIYLQCSTFNGEIGDYIPQVNGWVCGYGSGLYSSYNLAVACPEYGVSTNDSGNISPVDGSIAVPSIPNNSIPSMSLWIDGGESVNYQALYYPLALVPSASTRAHSKRYLKFSATVTAGPTIGGESTFVVTATVNPATNGLNTTTGANQLASSIIRHRFSPNVAKTHGDAVKFAVKSSGLSVNAATFTQADADLSANVSLTLPLGEAREFESYLDVVQVIASSTLGLARVNEAREIEYEIIKNPGALSIDARRSTINMLDGETSSSVEYQDIVTSVEFVNDQLNGLAEIAGTGAKATVDVPKAKQLHRVDRATTRRHCLESIQSRKAAITGYLSSPTVEYNLATSSEDLASNIGDVVEVTNTATANSGGVAVGVIVGLNQSGSKSSVKINEIRGVP